MAIRTVLVIFPHDLNKDDNSESDGDGDDGNDDDDGGDITMSKAILQSETASNNSICSYLNPSRCQLSKQTNPNRIELTPRRTLKCDVVPKDSLRPIEGGGDFRAVVRPPQLHLQGPRVFARPPEQLDGRIVKVQLEEAKGILAPSWNCIAG